MPKRILLADDSITIQKVVELTFSDGDYEIVSANNGARALQKLAESMPDIILSDIIMPEKNGYEVCEFVKSHPEYRDIPVILLTGTFEPFDPDRAEKAGCDAVVTKPFESQSLINKVEELIQKRAHVDDQARAARSEAFVNQPLESFVSSPAVEQPEPPAESQDPGMTMPWQIQPGDQPAESPEDPGIESPFSTGEPPPLPADADGSLFGTDSGWQPITDAEPQEGEVPAEPFDASPALEQGELQQNFEGESIFAPQDDPAQAEDDARAEGGFDQTPEPAPSEEDPFAPSEKSAEEEAEDASTRAWAVPVDGVWADPAAQEEREDSEARNTLHFPAAPEGGASEDPAFPVNAMDEGARADESISDEDDSQAPSPWTAGDEQPVQTAEEYGGQPAATTGESSHGDDGLWNVAPAQETRVPVDETSFTSEDEPADSFDAQPQSAVASQPEEEPVAPPAGEPVSETGAAGTSSRSLTDEDVERIARRVVELMTGDVVKNIAWEVVPDVAEMVVRERVRELENE